MNPSDAQRTVARFVESNGLEVPIEARLLDLVSEVGEVAKEVLQQTSYGRTQFRPSIEWADELGDVLFALVCVANTTSVDLASALDQRLAKYKDRLDSTGDSGSGK